MKNIIRYCFLLAVLLVPFAAYGDEVFSPSTYTTISSNKKYIFVMIAPGVSDRNATEQARGIRAVYPKSGMYLNDGSAKPLWTVDWYSFKVSVASDGVHIVRHGPLASSVADEAFTFFAGNQELRSYKVRDVAQKGVLRIASHIIWQADMKLDDEEKTLSVITLGEETYNFDYRSGERKTPHNQLTAIVNHFFQTDHRSLIPPATKNI